MRTKQVGCMSYVVRSIRHWIMYSNQCSPRNTSTHSLMTNQEMIPSRQQMLKTWTIFDQARLRRPQDPWRRTEQTCSRFLSSVVIFCSLPCKEPAILHHRPRHLQGAVKLGRKAEE